MKKYRFLILRRFIQISILVLFVLGNLLNLQILQGNLSSSLLFGLIPLSDPYAILQGLIAGASFSINAIIGAFIIFAFYAIFLSRSFCSFVCPLNLVTDLSNYIARISGLSKQSKLINLKRNTRFWVLLLSLLLSFIFGISAYESINPISILHRGVIWGFGFGAFVIIGVFLFDLVVLKHGFCGHLCPVGAFYSLVGKFAIFKVYHDSKKCTKCMECKTICPEVEVLGLIGKKDGFVGFECINCARCIEICDDDALKFSLKRIKNEK